MNELRCCETQSRWVLIRVKSRHVLISSMTWSSKVRILDQSCYGRSLILVRLDCRLGDKFLVESWRFFSRACFISHRYVFKGYKCALLTFHSLLTQFSVIQRCFCFVTCVSCETLLHTFCSWAVNTLDLVKQTSLKLSLEQKWKQYQLQIGIFWTYQCKHSCPYLSRIWTLAVQPLWMGRLPTTAVASWQLGW